MRQAKTYTLLLAALAALALAACGGGDDGGGDSAGGGSTTAGATDGEEAVSGRFQALPSAPAAYAGVSGEAELVRGGDGTTVSIEVSGLQPGDEYMAHLHVAGCDRPDPGGPHFKFDPDGSDQPPNEIHLSLTANEAGEGSARASNPQAVPPGEAGAVVLHVAGVRNQMALLVHEGKKHGGGGGGGGDGHGGGEGAAPDKIACAELEGGAPEQQAEGGASMPTIVVREGKPVGGVQQLEYSAGERIRFRVESDVAEEVHVHGYDISRDVAAGGAVSFDFPAEIEGIFEVELEGTATQIAELQVNP